MYIKQWSILTAFFFIPVFVLAIIFVSTGTGSSFIESLVPDTTVQMQELGEKMIQTGQVNDDIPGVWIEESTERTFILKGWNGQWQRWSWSGGLLHEDGDWLRYVVWIGVPILASFALAGLISWPVLKWTLRY